MRLLPRIGKNTWVILTSLIIIGAIYATYFLVFVPTQRESLTEERFRILNQYAQNVKNSFYDQVQVAFSQSELKPNDPPEKVEAILRSAIVDHVDSHSGSRKFDEFYVLNDSTSATIYQSFPSNITLPEMDSLKSMFDKPLSAGITIDIKISEVDYLGFIQQTDAEYRIDNKDGCFNITIGGLVKKKEFNKQTREVSSWLLTNAIILTLILLLSMPLLKLQLMSPIERLYQRNVIWLGLSLIMGFCFLTLIFQSTASFYRTKDKIPSKLERLSDTLSERFIQEVIAGYELIEEYDLLELYFERKKSQNCYGLNIKVPCEDTLPGMPVLENISIVKQEKDDSVITRINLIDYLSVSNWVDSILSIDSILRIDSILSIDSILRIDSILSIDSILRIDSDLFPNDIFWMDKKGYLRLILSTSQDSTRLPAEEMNLKGRKYFSKVLQNDLWNLQNDTVTISGFALESIVSWADGVYETAISKKSTAKFSDTIDTHPMEVVAVTITPSSLMDPILPEGFGYSIIDEMGNTWFHSDKKKIHNENFLDEISDRQTLVAAMKSRAEIPRTTFDYASVDHMAHISPIKDLPLQIVVFYDLRYIKYPIIQAVRTTIAILAFSFLLFLLHVAILYFFSYKSSQLKIRTFKFEWLSPQLEKVEQYVQLRNANLFILLVTVLTVMAFAVFNGHMYLYNTSVTLFFAIGLPIIILTYIHYSLNRNMKFVRASVAYLILLNLVYSLSESDDFFTLLFLQVLFILTIILAEKINLKPVIKDLPKENKAYVQFLITWLILASVIPVYFIFNSSYATEHWIWSKHNLLEIAKSNEIRDKDHDDLAFQLWSNGTESNKRKETFISQIKEKGQYYESLLNEENPKDSVLSKVDTFSNSFANFMRPLRAKSPELMNSTRFLIPDSSADNNWTWAMNKDTLSLLFDYNDGGAPRSFVNSQVYPFSHSFMVCICFWLILLIAICLMYFILQYAIGQIFGEKFRNFKSLNLSIGFLKDKNRNNRVLLIKMPLSGTENVIKKYFKSLKKTEYRKFEFSNIDDPDEKDKLWSKVDKCQIFLLTNFEYMSNNHSIWKEKLKLIQRLTKIENAQIIITSQIHPLDVIKFYELMIQKSAELSPNIEFKDKEEEYWHALAQWKKIFRGFIKVYDPIDMDPSKVLSDTYLINHLTKANSVKDQNSALTHGGADQDEPYEIPDSIRKLIVEELKYGTYLPKLVRLIVDYCLEHEVTDRDDIILRIQSLAQPYYYALWSSLNKEERFLIFDLAKDGFVNLKNDNGAKVLQEKGLFVFKDKLTLMNESFNNFILTIVSREMERDMQRELSKKGSWNTIRIVLVLIVLSVIAFVAQGQQEFMDNLYTVLGAIVAGAGLFLRFGDMTMFGSGDMNGKQVIG